MVQVTSALPIAKMVGSNRVILGHGIVHVTGDASMSPQEEKEMRLRLVKQALEALQTESKQKE